MRWTTEEGLFPSKISASALLCCNQLKLFLTTWPTELLRPRQFQRNWMFYYKFDSVNLNFKLSSATLLVTLERFCNVPGIKSYVMCKTLLETIRSWAPILLCLCCRTVRLQLCETTNLVQDGADETLKRCYLGNKVPVLTLFKGVTQTVTLPTARCCSSDLSLPANTSALTLMEKWNYITAKWIKKKLEHMRFQFNVIKHQKTFYDRNKICIIFTTPAHLRQ